MKILTRQEIHDIVNKKCPGRPVIASAIPMEQDGAKYGAKAKELVEKYPDDVLFINITIDYWNAPEDDGDYRFAMRGMTRKTGLAIDACPIIEKWDDLGRFLHEFPSSYRKQSFDRIRKLREENPDRYILVSFGHYFFQRMF